ncbi:MAG: PqqD family peptide modification chaperone [Thermodesulfovibrionales bacterium]|jgi:hypothetical protein
MEPITDLSAVVSSKSQVSADLAGEVVILSIEKGVYYGLNEVAARIWSLIQEPKRVADISEIILSEYEVEHEKCRHDIKDLLHLLHNEGLIEVMDEMPS